jgi:hypothetical protein
MVANGHLIVLQVGEYPITLTIIESDLCSAALLAPTASAVR